MKVLQFFLFCITCTVGSSLSAKEVDLRGSGFAKTIIESYKAFDQQGMLYRYPTGWKVIYDKIEEGTYIFDDHELSECIPNWQQLYYTVSRP